MVNFMGFRIAKMDTTLLRLYVKRFSIFIQNSREFQQLSQSTRASCTIILQLPSLKEIHPKKLCLKNVILHVQANTQKLGIPISVYFKFHTITQFLISLRCLFNPEQILIYIGKCMYITLCVCIHTYV